jgi:methylmalonyl-CoA mutase
VQAPLQRERSSLLREWPARLKSITDEITEYQVRDKTIRVENYRESLSTRRSRRSPRPPIAAGANC